MSQVESDYLRVLRGTASFGLVAIITSNRPWASALFVGYHLTIIVKGDDDAAFDAWLISLPELELAWRGYFAASAEVIERSENAATIELLVVEA